MVMGKAAPYSLIYAPQVYDHLRSIDARHHSLIRTKIEEQLRFEPDRVTRNRKPLTPPVTIEATWELRFGPGNQFRVFYDVNRKDREVQILAIGTKTRNRLQIGGEDVDL
jgi:mRNA-degrading endonuclease RelE of RelBE toxin-antitoxin system